MIKSSHWKKQRGDLGKKKKLIILIGLKKGLTIRLSDTQGTISTLTERQMGLEKDRREFKKNHFFQE